MPSMCIIVLSLFLGYDEHHLNICHYGFISKRVIIDMDVRLVDNSLSELCN